MLAKHPNMNMATANCVSCHDPHVQRKTAHGLLKEFKHDPFARGECTSCHVTKGAPALVAKGRDLCFKCHAPAAQWLTQKHVHPPLQTQAECLSCHEPHAASGLHLVRQNGDGLCYSCHDRKKFEGKVVHGALEQGCTTCHSPHASDNAKLTLTPVSTLCQQCHDDLSKHFHKVSGVKDPRTGEELTCVGCHRPHVSEFDHLLTGDPKRELCIQCHDPNMEPTPKKK
jgi:predicted CXXCH cytochrome family protein